MSYGHAVDQVYYAPLWKSKAVVYKTNTPNRSAVRAPGEIQASYTMETIIERIACETGLPPHVVRERNFYTEGNMNGLNGMPITNWTMPKLWDQLKSKGDFDTRMKSVLAYNQEHRVRKRGIAITPVKYLVYAQNRGAFVNIYRDGSVRVAHDAIEMGQGIHTKVIQSAAYTLGTLLGVSLDDSKIIVTDSNSNASPIGGMTGGSTSSENACLAVMNACKVLVGRLKPHMEKLQKAREGADADKKSPVTWEAVVGAACGANPLSATSSGKADGAEGGPTYFNYGAAVSEVELDVLTGEIEVLATDMLYDCGKSLNPAVDIGQCEGGFMMGLGYYLREEVVRSETGEDITAGTWEYKPPMAVDAPQRFTVSLLQDTNFEKGVLSSKASGEPPLVLATSVCMALRMAIASARADAGLTGWFDLASPMTPARIRAAVGTKVSAGLAYPPKQPSANKEEQKQSNGGKGKGSNKKKNKKKSNKKKNKKNKKKQAVVVDPDKDEKKLKAALKEGGKKGQDIAGLSEMGGVRFFHVSLDSPEGNWGLMDKCFEGFNKKVDPEAEDRKGGAGNIAKTLFSYKDNTLIFLTHVPTELQEKAQIQEWFDIILKVTGGKQVGKSDDGTVLKGEVICDPDKGQYAIKVRDDAIQQGYGWLTNKQLVLVDESDDDFVYGDDDFPDYY